MSATTRSPSPAVPVLNDNDDALGGIITRLSRPIVFTNGCFDILHVGHVTLLEQAAGLGESLIVGVNSDNSVRRLEKGADRPFNTQAQRTRLLSALRSVDCVVVFDADTPLELIRTVKPDVLVKGGDWSIDAIVGADLVQQNGGSVRSIPFIHQTSTTALVERIRNSSP